jgi:nitrate/nitrite-specific signal transduction histidine kinase
MSATPVPHSRWVPTPSAPGTIGRAHSASPASPVRRGRVPKIGPVGPSDYLPELVRINDTLIWSRDRADSYVEAVRIIRDLMGASLAPSFMLDETETKLVLVTDEEQRAFFMTRGFESLPAPRHLRPPWINEGEWPVSAADHLDHESWEILPDAFKEWFGTSGVVVPVHADGRHLGAVLLAFDGDFVLTDEKRAFLAVAGRILGNAVYRWQVGERERELGALVERRHLADELHVDLSQQVAALGLRVEALKLDLEHNDRAQLDKGVSDLTDLVMSVKRSLRHQMLGLRADADLLNTPFTVTVLEHCRAFEERFNIPVDIDVGDRDAADNLPVPVAAQLVRVLQEALSNTYLHAFATRVGVHVETANRRVRLEIVDNGKGFDPASVPDSRLGLTIMRERMSQLEGTLNIVVRPQGGTCVTAEAPLRLHTPGSTPPGARRMR